MPNSASQVTKLKSKNNEFSSTADIVRIYLHQMGASHFCKYKRK